MSGVEFADQALTLALGGAALRLTYMFVKWLIGHPHGPFGVLVDWLVGYWLFHDLRRQRKGALRGDRVLAPGSRTTGIPDAGAL